VALHVPFPGICEYNKLIIFSIDVIPWSVVLTALK
jgi:hypothetical protein